VEYDVRVYAEREAREPLFRALTRRTWLRYEVPEPERMYFVEIRAVDAHRRLNPETWYPAARLNFALVPPERYGWYGVL